MDKSNSSIFKIKFCGAAKGVTGSNHLVTVNNKKILLDCGMFQGNKYGEQNNYSDFPYDPKEIGYVLLSHAHADHCGRIPKLYRDGFRGTIYCVKPTFDIARIVLLDSVNIVAQEAKEIGISPFMSNDDVMDVLSHFNKVDFFEEIKLDDEILVKFLPAGHILGSALVQIETQGKKLLYTGDLGNSPSPLIQETYYPKDVNYLITESTYGDRNHIQVNKRRDFLKNVITAAIKKNGVLLIPSFAVERTQELLYDINNLVENEIIPQVPVFIDSPMAIKVTDVYNNYPQYFSRMAKADLCCDDELFNFPGLQLTYSREQSKEINNVPAPKIIIAGSGMSIGGRILYHEQRYLSNPNTTLLMVGFQVQGSLGRKLLDGYSSVNILGTKVEVKAEIISIPSYSAHADQNGILKFIDKTKDTLEKIFIVHGEPEASLELSNKIKKEYKKETYIPNEKQEIEIK